MDMQFGRAEVADADGLNRLAREHGWGVRCDLACRFIFRDLTDLLELWQSKAAGGIPRRSDLTPRLLLPYMKSITLHERVQEDDGSRRYRIRLMGDAIAQMIGPAAGKFYEEFIPAEFVPLWNAMNDAVLGCGRPLRMVVREETFKRAYLAGEFIAAPMRQGDGPAHLVLTAGRFDSMLRWEDIVAEFAGGGTEPAAPDPCPDR